MEQIYKISELSPTISTENLGDYIIQMYCDEAIRDIFGDALVVRVPTKEKLGRGSQRQVASSDFAFVCGSNLLTSNMKKEKQWNISLLGAAGIKIGGVSKKELLHPAVVKEKAARVHIIMMGTGWRQYQGMPTKYTKRILSVLLDKTYMHSVRDSYTQEMLKKIGITNVLNTACPSMWHLTEDHCSKIPIRKSDSVVTTLTNYNRNMESDTEMLNMLKRNYKNVFVWLQAIEDLVYLQSLEKHMSYGGGIQLVPPSLSAYTSLLESCDIDYVGTRLHGGIRALNCKKRSLILAVDNRATEIAKDTGLPVMDRKSDIGLIEEKINSKWETEIILPIENIYRWRNQF